MQVERMFRDGLLRFASDIKPNGRREASAKNSTHPKPHRDDAS